MADCDCINKKVNHLFCLPEEILEKVFSNLSYDDISKMRLVSKKVDKCCQRLLNQGFLKVEKFHSLCLRDIKAQLPRRESERRDHPLARHSDILTAIETRLSLLSMTFMKYIDMNLCCFIPGKVIDEIYLVLRNIQSTPSPPRSHEILQELRDISSMAMEHFDEHIVPLLKQKLMASRHTMPLNSEGAGLNDIANAKSANPCIGSSALRRELHKLQMSVKQLTNTSTQQKKEIGDLKQKSCDMRKKIREQEKKVSEQNNILTEQASRITEQDGKISEISRKMLECDRHISNLLSELNRYREHCDASGSLPSLKGTTESSVSTGECLALENEDAKAIELNETSKNSGRKRKMRSSTDGGNKRKKN